MKIYGAVAAGMISGLIATAVYQGSSIFPGIVAAITFSVITYRFHTATEIYMELLETLLENPIQMLITLFFVYFSYGAATALMGINHIIFGAGASMVTVCLLLWIGKYVE